MLDKFHCEFQMRNVSSMNDTFQDTKMELTVKFYVLQNEIDPASCREMVLPNVCIFQNTNLRDFIHMLPPVSSGSSENGSKIHLFRPPLDLLQVEGFHEVLRLPLLCDFGKLISLLRTPEKTQ